MASLPASIAFAKRTSSSLVSKRVLTDVGQIQTNEILVIAFNAIIGHGGSSLSGPNRVDVVAPPGFPGPPS